MALISSPFEEIFSFPRYYAPAIRYSPVGHGLLASLLDDSFGELQQLERQLGQIGGDLLQPQEAGNNNGDFTFKCNVAGYRPEELQVNVQGDQLVIQGEHRHQGDGQSIHRTFKRLVTLPENVHKESVQCSIDERGRLEVRAQAKAIEPAQQRRNIPIGFRQSNDANGGEQQKMVKGSEEGKKK